MRVDDDGYFLFRGRKKQIIVHDASNICPQEVEDALLAHPSVASAGVIGIHDLVHGENVRAYITLTEGTEWPASQELIQFARQGRLQGARGNSRPRPNATHCHRETGPDAPQANGRGEPHA
jgi:acyl-coenzyme A synthetase/AMP-(fatty) acid ligase